MADDPFADLVPTKPKADPFSGLVQAQKAAPADPFADLKPKVAEKPSFDLFGLKQMGRDITEAEKSNREELVKDFTTVPTPGYGNDWMDRNLPPLPPLLMRAAKVAGDVPQYLASPLQGAAKTTLGRPAEALTGGRINAENIGRDVSMAGQMLAAPESLAKVRAAPKPSIPPAMKDGLDAVEKVFSPTTVAPEAGATERTIRAATGQATLDTDKAAHALAQYQPIVGNLPVQQQREIVSYLENRSAGAKLADPKLQNAADAIRKTYQDMRTKIERTLPEDQQPGFIQDYYAHLWKEKPSNVQDSLNAYYAKQGTGRNLKARTLPTIEDGIKAGLTPRIENPIDNTMAYVRGMNRYLATHDIQDELRAQGYAKWYAPGQQPKGWRELNGIKTSKIALHRKGSNEPIEGANQINMYAPEPVARVYNNFISKGFESGDAGPFWDAARKASNGLTMAKLGLSTFHLGTMVREQTASDFARAFAAASRGEVKTAAKGARPLAVPYVGSAVGSYRRGLKMQRELLDLKTPDRMSKQVNDAFVRSGGTLGMDRRYRVREAGSFFNSIQNGTFKRDLMSAGQRIFGKNQAGGWDRAKGTVDLAANVVQSVAAPLFEDVIPKLKRGAFSSLMEDWFNAHPNATQEEIDKAAVSIQDSIDNRFGELSRDNLFWHQQMKQAAQILLLSPTWDLGTVREIGGGLADIPRSVRGVKAGEGITNRTAYVAGLATLTALEGGILTYLATGEAPKGPRDLMAPRTGGTDAASGQPERALTPGYQKDVFAFGFDFPHHVLQESINKLNPALSTGIGLLTNKDYRGLPIYPGEGVETQPEDKGLGDYLWNQLMPISLGQFQRKQGSNIGPVERTLAVRPAPSFMQAPERVEELRQRADQKAWNAKRRSDARIEQQMEK